jgi:hypothetical protein
MPIVFVHGVNVRDTDDGYREGLDRLTAYLRRYVAPEIDKTDPAAVPIVPVYWGGYGVHLAWNDASRPRSLLLRQGAADDIGLAQLVTPVSAAPNTFAGLPPEPAATPVAPGGLIAAGPTGDQRVAPLTTLSDDELSDVLATAALASTTVAAERTLLTLAADDVAHDAVARKTIDTETNRDAQLRVAAALVEASAKEIAQEAAPGLLAQGAPAWLGRFGERLHELVDRAESAPAWAVSHALLEARPALNTFVTRFIGDVFVYLRDRGTPGAPGPIPRTLLDALAAAKKDRPGEPLVVLSHSMGGQLVYDAVTAFLAAPPYDGVRVDFWAAAASQVGLFEEMKLFCASDPRYHAGAAKVPFPDRSRLGGWWNVYDRTDVLSFTAKAIVDGVDDEEFSSGVPMVGAHGGYFTRPSFFRRFGEKVAEARDARWYKP